MAMHVFEHLVIAQVQREHEQFRERLKFVRHQLELRQAPLEEIENLLKELLGCLDLHFHDEEREGFFDQIVSRAPQLARQAERLSLEHADLLRSLDSIIRIAERGTGQPIGWRLLTFRFEDFTKKLLRHESAENRLLQQAFSDDFGTKD